MHHDRLEDYATRIARAVKLLEQHDGGEAPPDLARLANAAAFSPFHFHRVFRLMTGETVGAAIRRIRLAKTLSELTDGVASITQAAAGSGYATSQAFARSMRQAAGVTSSEIRADPDLAKTIAERLRSAPSPDTPLGIEVVSLAPFTVAALRRTGPLESLDEGYNALFGAVFQHFDMDALAGIWGVPLDDPFSVAAKHCSFDCAVDIGGAAVPDVSVKSVVLGGGAALAMDRVGSYDDVHEAFDHLYRHALVNERELAHAPPIVHYHDQPDEKPPEELRATLYLFVA